MGVKKFTGHIRRANVCLLVCVLVLKLLLGGGCRCNQDAYKCRQVDRPRYGAVVVTPEQEAPVAQRPRLGVGAGVRDDATVQVVAHRARVGPGFAAVCADQTEQDHQSLVEAIKSGRVLAETGI